MKNIAKIVVNADDFGMSVNKNIAIDQMMRKGVCTNASLVVNMNYSDEAVRLAYEGGYEDRLSLHINLTEGRALSEGIKKRGNLCIDLLLDRINRCIHFI